MKKKVVVLVDGQALYYDLKDMKVLEKDIRWDAFFNSLLNENEEELIRTYWFRPQKILDTFFTLFTIRNEILKRKFSDYYLDYRGRIEDLPAPIYNALEAEAKKVEDWLNHEKERFKQIEYIYEQLQLENEGIEIVKSGYVKVNPYTEEYYGEKGVDVALSVKMVSLAAEKKCDKIILFGGDSDYAEAIRYAKNCMLKVHIVKFWKDVNARFNNSVSRELSLVADKVLIINEKDFKSKFCKTIKI